MHQGLAFLIGLILVCDLAVVGIHVLDDKTNLISDKTAQGPGGPERVVPAPGQAFVRGTVERLSADNAQGEPLESPLTITAVERGVGRLTIDQAMVGGRRVTISWDGGVPLPLSGDGGIELGASHIEVDAEAIVWSLDGSPRKLMPGTYTAGAPVAVGTGGLAAPRDGVQFTADDQTVLQAQGAVVVRLEPERIEIRGPGKVTASGQLKVQFSDRTESASSFTFGEGPFRMTLEPKDGRVEVDGILQGQVDTG